MKIMDIANHEWEGACIGCALVRGELLPPGGIIKETPHFILHQDPEIPIKGFLIIASKEHIKSIGQISKEEASELFQLCYDARKALLSLPDILECALIQEERSEHFHLWIFPRYAWMNGIFDNSLSSIRPMMKYAKDNLKSQSNIAGIMETVKALRMLLGERTLR